MTASDPLSRLRAGLDRDERLAQGTRQAGMRWRDFSMPRALRDNYNRGTVAENLIDEDRDHIARQDPQATLRRVEAIRKVLADLGDPATFDDHYGGAIDYTSFRQGVAAATELLTATLASIYPDDVTEGLTP